MNKFCIIYNILAAAVAVALAIVNATWKKPQWSLVFVALAICNVLAAYTVFRLDRKSKK